MADNQRIEDLRRRVQKDPASIAFAQLAEELRRSAQFEESIEICRAGLAIHPGYLSARVTLGRVLLELNQLDDARAELEHVLASAPENLAAIRGLAEINHRNGDLPTALTHYRAALTLAKNDPDLQETVSDLSKKVEPPKPPASADGLSLEQVTRELFLHRPPPVAVNAPQSDFFAAPPQADPAAAAEPETSDALASPSEDTAPPPVVNAAAFDFFATASSPPADLSTAPEAEPPAAEPVDLSLVQSNGSVIADAIEPSVADPVDLAIVEPIDQFESELAGSELATTPQESLEPPAVSSPEPLDPHAPRVIAALEHWLEAIHVARDQHGA